MLCFFPLSPVVQSLPDPDGRRHPERPSDRHAQDGFLQRQQRQRPGGHDPGGTGTAVLKAHRLPLSRARSLSLPPSLAHPPMASLIAYSLSRRSSLSRLSTHARTRPAAHARCTWFSSFVLEPVARASPLASDTLEPVTPLCFSTPACACALRLASNSLLACTRALREFSRVFLTWPWTSWRKDQTTQHRAAREGSHPSIDRLLVAPTLASHCASQVHPGTVLGLTLSALAWSS